MADKVSALDRSKINFNYPETASRDGLYSGIQNPYSNQDYTEGWISRTLGDLGFRTKTDQRREDLSVQAAETEFGLALKQHDEQYNSEAAKAARMRAAGLNPDLQGIGDASEASPMGEDPSTPAGAPVGDLDDAMSIGSAILSGVSTAISFAKDITSLEGMDLQNLSLGAESFSQLFPAEVLEDGQIRTDLAIDMLNRGSEFSRSLRPRARKRYMNNLQNFIGSMNYVTGAYAKASAEKGSHADLFDAISRAGSEVNTINLKLAELISDINSTLTLVRSESAVSVAGAEGAEGDLRRQIAENTDPVLAAEAINEENRAKRNTKSIEASLAEPVAQKLDDFSDMAQNGSGLASKVLLGLSIAASTSPFWSRVLGRAVKITKSKSVRKFVSKKIVRKK